MATIQVLAATTSDGVVGNFDASGYEWIIVHVNALVGAEEVAIYALSSGALLEADTESGADAKLTATIRQLRLEGGIQYQFEKTTTVSPCAIFVTPGDAKER